MIQDKHGSELRVGDHARVVENRYYVHGRACKHPEDRHPIGEVFTVHRESTSTAHGENIYFNGTMFAHASDAVERVVEDSEGSWVGIGDRVKYTPPSSISGVFTVDGFTRDTRPDQDAWGIDTGIELAEDTWERVDEYMVRVDDPDPEPNDAETARGGIQVYVAGPFSEGDLEQNIRQVIFAAEILVERGDRQGHHVAPWIPHLNKLWHDEVPHEYDFWLDLDFVHLSNCDACFRVGGHSPGADRERAVCEDLGIPYFTCFHDYEEWLEDYDGHA